MSTHTASVRDVPMRPSPVPTGRTSTAATSASSATAGRHFQYRNLLNFLKLNFNFFNRDVFSAWVASGQGAPPGYPPPVK